MKSFIAALRSLVLPYGRTSGTRIVLDGVNGKIQVYNADNVLVAEVTPSGGFDGTAGFIAYSPTGGSSYAMLTNASVEFGDDEVTAYSSSPEIVHSATGGVDSSELLLSSGAVSDAETPVQVVLESSNGLLPPIVNILALAGTADLNVSGKFTSGNIRSGSAQTPAPGVAPGTSSVGVVFPAMRHVPNVFLTPDSAADPTDTTIRGYATDIGINSFTINCGRETNFATNWSWLAIDDA